MIHHRFLVAVFAIFIAPRMLFAWGDRGHEMTGVIAYARLTAPVKNQVNAFLAGDRDTLTPADFVSRTLWADEYRDSDRATTKRRYDATRNWHFVNINITTGKISGCNPKLPAGTPASAGPANACIIDKIEQFAAELHDRSTTTRERLLALKFLLHLIGDLHHPLHTADNRDRGGNDVTAIFGSPPQRESLHSYWDNYLVHQLGSDSRTVAQSLDRQITPAQAQTWAKGTPFTWAKETFQVGKTVAYDFAAHRNTENYGGDVVRLDAAYERRAISTVKAQLSRAGVRLAALLNSAFK